MPDFDFNRMQSDAIRRAREMQSRARTPQHRTQAPAEPPAPPPEPEEQSAPPPAPEQPPVSAQAQPSLLDNLFQDRESTIILALLILLSGEDNNHELMFALMFLLM